MSNKRSVAVVTGGSMGLGFELAKALLKAGFGVAICARHEDRLNQAVEELEAYGDVFGLAGDVADAGFTERLLAETALHFGRINALVNNASTLGELPLPTLLDTSVENLERVFAVNTFAPITITKQALSYLADSTRGLVLFISSDAAVGGYAQWGVYGASKAALDLVAKTFAAELPEEISVFSVDPSDMDTAMHRDAVPDATGLLHPEHIAKVLTEELFLPILSAQSVQFQSGTRFTVEDGKRLKMAGVRQ